VQVRALEGDFPYYGKLETTPVAAGTTFRTKQAAVVDKTLLLQFNAKPGDTVQVGNIAFVIEGSLMKAPGQTGLSASVAPAVYIPLAYLEATGLTEKGSRITHNQYYKFNNPASGELLVNQLETQLDTEGFDYETVESQKRDTGRSFEDLTSFLGLVGFTALLLGCIGVASAIHIYVREKINMIAILRCLGTKSSQAFLIYLFQVVGVGTIASLTGAGLGMIIQRYLPALLQDFLPVEIRTTISWTAIGQGIALGIIISVLFGLLPLLSIRNISPLNTLRFSFQPKSIFKDPLKWLLYLLIILFLYGFVYIQLKEVRESIVFMMGILIAFLLLSAMAALLMWSVRRFFPSSWSYLWRQGLANLFRPNNQTMLLVVSIGLGTSLICMLFFVQSLLVNRVTLTAGVNQHNMVLFDIQSDQRDKLVQLTRLQGLPVSPTVPIVNMRLEEWNGLTAAKAEGDTSLERAQRLFSREFRVTYRDSLTQFEKVTAGTWKGRVQADGSVPISIEKEYARRHDIEIGDTLLFNVQGAMVPTIVSSFREVDWNRVQTNFLVVFPAGILEEAPQFHVLLTHVPTSEVSALYQQAVVREFPNVSIIDLALVLSVIDDIMDKIAFVIRFIAGFSIITGLVVLIASVLISKYQRIEESVLLRTLGAVRKQIFSISALEYFFLGALAAATGILLALAGSWALAKYTFKTTFTPEWWPVAAIFFGITLLTVTIGLVNSREVLSKPPLEILRRE
jgi:putative ABC transport system permease protein